MQNLKHKMQDDTFPFTREQLERFRREMDEAGDFDNLMIEKKALVHRKGTRYVAKYFNSEFYKEKYLTGVYEPLREMYDTEYPYSFWSDMYEILQASEKEIE